MTTMTNVHNIDEAIAQVVRRDTFYDTPDADFSVTQLIQPPQLAYLRQTHEHEITEDVSDQLWMLLGNAVHEIVRRADLPDALHEERLYADVEGCKIAGKADILRGTTITDYKCTSVWSFLLGDKPDWEAQLNFYAVLFRRNGFEVGALEIAAILRDWMKSKAQQAERGEQGEYPPVAFMRVPIKVWPPEEAEKRLAARVRLHKEARAGRFPPCTDEERWARPDKYAVMKPKQKRAVRVLDSKAEAEALIEERGSVLSGARIEYRPGKNVRCEDYCPVAQWCEQARELGVRIGR